MWDKSREISQVNKFTKVASNRLSSTATKTATTPTPLQRNGKKFICVIHMDAASWKEQFWKVITTYVLENQHQLQHQKYTTYIQLMYKRIKGFMLCLKIVLKETFRSFRDQASICQGPLANTDNLNAYSTQWTAITAYSTLIKTWYHLAKQWILALINHTEWKNQLS